LGYVVLSRVVIQHLILQDIFLKRRGSVRDSLNMVRESVVASWALKDWELLGKGTYSF